MLALAVALPFTELMAQPTEKNKKEDVEIEIHDNRITIEAQDLDNLSQMDLNSIIKQVAKRAQVIVQQQEELMAKVNKQLANDEITEEEAEEMRDMITDRTEESMEMIGSMMEAWGENYETRMEAWEAAYEAKMEAWEAEVEARAERGEFSIPPIPALPPIPHEAPTTAGGDTSSQAPRVIIDGKGITIKKGKDGDKPFALRFEEEMKDNEGKDQEPRHEKPKHDDVDRPESYFDIHLGFNQMLKNGENFITDESEELKFWKSTAFELGLGAKTRIGSPASKLYLKYGAEVSWHNFRLTGNNTLQKLENDVKIIKDTTRSISMTKYHIAYFNIPLMLQLDFSEVGERDESFTLGAGGYAGIRLNAKRELEYSNDIFDEAEEKVQSDFFTNQFRYGLMAQIGWDSFKITAKYDLNEFFEAGKGPDYQMAQVSVGFTF